MATNSPTIKSNKPRDTKYHLLPDPNQSWVSKLSRFDDDVWRLDLYTPGQAGNHNCINWSFPVSDASIFTDPKYNQLLQAMKRFVWSLFSDPRNRRRLTAGSATHVSKGIRFLARWMIRNQYAAFSELDRAACKAYLDDLAIHEIRLASRADTLGVEQSERSMNDASYELTEAAFTPGIRILKALWQQSSALVDAGVAPIPNDPLAGESAKSIARKLATKAIGWIEPLPDEVALPIMTAAHRMIGVPAEDVLRLQSLYLEAAESVKHCVPDRQAIIAGNVITGFTFSTIPGDQRPWREPVVAGTVLRYADSRIYNSNLDVHCHLRRLIEQICAACVIVTQSETGMRINEICGLAAGLNPANGLPASVEIRASKTGLHDLFYLKGRLSKTEVAPLQVEWLLGARPKGTKELPTPVRALIVLHKLYEHLRNSAANRAIQNELIVSFSTPRGYPRNGKMLGEINRAKLLRYQRDFVLTWCDFSTLPDKNSAGQDLSHYRASRGTCLLSHSWRKTFALYVFRVDPRMIPAIAQQFHHLTLAMTDEGYIGNDPTILEAMNSVRVQQTVRFMYEAVRGERLVTGRLAKLIEDHKAELEQLITEDPSDPKRSLEAWVIEQDLRIWFAPHGKCFIQLSPAQSRCHELAGTAHWAHHEPNYAFRNPDTCLGCALYAVDGDHAAFWLQRYSENQAAWDRALASGVAGDYRVAGYRADQSAIVLRSIGVPLPLIGPTVHTQ